MKNRVDQFFAWRAKRVLRSEQCMYRRRDILLTVASWGLVIFGSFVPGVVAHCIMVLFAGAGCGLWLSRRRAYWHGWGKSRTAVFSSLDEARRRGWSFSEWYRIEIQADLDRLGIKEGHGPV